MHAAPEDETCQDVVAMQARTIRALLNNYQLLLDKYAAETGEKDLPYVITWQAGTAVNIAAAAVIPAGLYYDTSSAEVMYSDGSQTAAEAVTLAPLTARLTLQPPPQPTG